MTISKIKRPNIATISLTSSRYVELFTTLLFKYCFNSPSSRTKMNFAQNPSALTTVARECTPGIPVLNTFDGEEGSRCGS